MGSFALSRNRRRLSSSNWEGASVELRFAGQSAVTTSGHGGNFEASFDVASLGERLLSGSTQRAAVFEVLAEDSDSGPLV